MVRFENVGMRYGLGPEILRDISFTIDAGSFQLLTGPSGAGKTSLLKLIYLAERPSRGAISMFGRDIAVTPRDELPALAAAHRRRVPGFSSARSFDRVRQRVAAAARDGRIRGTTTGRRSKSSCRGWAWAIG